MPSNAIPQSLDVHRVFLALQNRIIAGEYPQGAWLPPERLLAEELCVNRATIRKAFMLLEEEGWIIRQTGRRPWVCREAHVESVVNSTEKRGTELQTIVAIMPQHPVYLASSHILHGINVEVRMKEAPIRLMIYNSHGDTAEDAAEFERRALLAVENEKIAGIILWHVGHDETLPILSRMIRRGVPVVFVDRYPQKLDSCDFVGVDNRESAAEAVRYLLSLGHTRIAHLTSTEACMPVQERLLGYQDALRAAGIFPRTDWVYNVPEGTTPNLLPAVDYLLGLPEPPTAVFTLNDALAHYFISAAESAGYHVPGQISVIGFDDLERHSPRPPLLSTMHQPFDRIGQRAAQILLRRLNSTGTPPAVHQHILMSAPLIARSTCKSRRKEEIPAT